MYRLVAEVTHNFFVSCTDVRVAFDYYVAFVTKTQTHVSNTLAV